MEIPKSLFPGQRTILEAANVLQSPFFVKRKKTDFYFYKS